MHSLPLLYCCLLSFSIIAAKYIPFNPFDPEQDDDNSTPDEEWDIFKKAFEKKIDSATEEAEAKEQFLQHRKFIRTHNKDYKSGRSPFKIGFNENADKNEKVLIKKRLGFRKSSKRPTGFPTVFKNAGRSRRDVPKSLNYTAMGWTTKVWDQGMCGSCWAFTANAVVEGQISKRHQYEGKPLLIKLSEQQLMDCSKSYGTHGCDGGDPAMAWHYLGDHGSMRESQYPYESRNGTVESTCDYRDDKDLPYHVIQTVKTGADRVRFSFGYFKSRDVDSILTGLREIGPLAASMNSMRKNFFLYSGGVYKEGDCSSTNRDHSVTIVGYGTDKRSGLDYWIIKNSWGTKWGMQGYGLIARGVNMCGIEMDVTYTTLAEEEEADGKDLRPSKHKRVTWTAEVAKKLKGDKAMSLLGSKKIM